MAAVLVHIDLDGDRPHASSLAALAAGRHVASSWGATLYAALVVHDPDERPAADATGRLAASTKVPGIEANERALARAGADKIVVAITDAPVAPLWSAVGAAWLAVLDHLRPRVVLFGADSPSAWELGPRTGARLGARFLSRARVTGGDDVELRDRDGGYARIGDSGASVALIGRADPAGLGEEDIDLVVLAIPGGGDARVELAGTSPAELAHTSVPIVALGDAVAANPAIVTDAKRLASLLGGHVVTSAAVARTAAPAGVVDRTTPLAPELYVTVGAAPGDLAGAASLVSIGTPGGRTADGALPGLADVGLAELVKRLEEL